MPEAGNVRREAMALVSTHPRIITLPVFNLAVPTGLLDLTLFAIVENLEDSYRFLEILYANEGNLSPTR